MSWIPGRSRAERMIYRDRRRRTVVMTERPEKKEHKFWDMIKMLGTTLAVFLAIYLLFLR